LQLAYAYTFVYAMSRSILHECHKSRRPRVSGTHRHLPGIGYSRRRHSARGDLGVYVPTRRKQPKAADLSELKAAADRLAEALADVDEEEFVANFKQLRRRGKAKQLK